LSELDTKNNITVYPNPTNGSFYLDNAEVRDVTATIFDVLGKKIMQDIIIKAGEKYQFNTNLSKGSYLLTIKDKDNSYSKKLVITE